MDASIIESKKQKIKLEEIDTIVVSANEKGFNEVFLGQDSWYAVRISKAMLNRIKYIAGYQAAPVSAVTYYAEVKNIEKYKETDKYVIYFKDKAKKIEPIRICGQKGTVPRGPRYTTFRKLLKAKTLKELWYA